MSLTGNFIDAETALRIGLVNHLAPHEQLLPLAMSLAQAIAEQDRRMVRDMRADWDASYGLPFAEAHRVHREHRDRSAFSSRSSADIAERREAVLARSREQRGD